MFALLMAGFVALVVTGRGDGAHPGSTAAADAGADAARDAAPAVTAAADAGEPTDADASDEPSAATGGDPLLLAHSDAGGTLLTGEAPPALAADAPKSVIFGVILVHYKGAQGAPANARSRDDALTLAKELAVEAKTDFKAAVAKGDKGSMENAGRMPRGMLEPAPEYVLFSMAKEGVSDPVDTPRGFWIVRRID